MKILTICPTYKRPDLCKKMMESWHNTIDENNTMVLGIDISDPFLTAYSTINTNKIICKANSTVTEVINSIWVEYPDYDYYHIINDDVIFHTKNYDSKMVNVLDEYGGGIAYGNDLFQGKNLPTFPFVSAKLAKAVGYLQLPTLNRYCGDTVWHDIGMLSHCLYYLGEIIIEHKHKLAGKGSSDVDMPIFQKDWHSYVEWATHSMKLDVGKVKEVLDGAS